MRGAPRRGVSLLEVILALVVLEVGMAGAVATVFLARRHLARAWSMERARAAAAALADSLTSGLAPREGVREGRGFRLRWDGATAGWIRVRVLVEGDTVARALAVRLPGGEEEGR